MTLFKGMWVPGLLILCLKNSYLQQHGMLYRNICDLTQVNLKIAWVSARHHVIEGFLLLCLQALGVLRNMLLLFSY